MSRSGLRLSFSPSQEHRTHLSRMPKTIWRAGKRGCGVGHDDPADSREAGGRLRGFGGVRGKACKTSILCHAMHVGNSLPRRSFMLHRKWAWMWAMDPLMNCWKKPCSLCTPPHMVRMRNKPRTLHAPTIRLRMPAQQLKQRISRRPRRCWRLHVQLSRHDGSTCLVHARVAKHAIMI